MNYIVTPALRYYTRYHHLCGNLSYKFLNVAKNINCRTNTFFVHYFATSNANETTNQALVTSPRDTIINNKYILDPDDYDRGIDNLKQTLKIQLMSLPYFSEEIAHSYLNLAMAEHQNILLLDNAREHYMASYKIFCKIRGSKSLEALNALTNFAVVLRDLGHLKESASILQNVLNYKKTTDTNPRLLLDTLNNLGVIMHEMKNYNNALVYYKEALQLIGNPNNFICEFVALVYFNIGCAYRESGSIPEAIENMKISKDICNKLDCPVELKNRVKLELENISPSNL